MRKKTPLLNCDRDGLYTILEIHINYLHEFFYRFNRRILFSPIGISDQPRAPRNRDVPSIKDFAIFLNTSNQIASVVIFFEATEDQEFINHYLQKMRRRYIIEANSTYSQLVTQSDKSEDIFLLPRSIGMDMVDSLSVMTLWLAAKNPTK